VRTAQVVLSSNDPAQAIVDYAVECGADLIVLGTHGRSGVSRMLMGSVAERVVRTAPCPVLTVHDHEHQLVREDLQKTAEQAK
jgi:universal stress protein A